jgi:hypothetical protein
MNGQPWPAVAGTGTSEGPWLRGLSIKGHLLLVAAVLVVALAVMEPATSGGIGLLARVLFLALHVLPAVAVAWVISGWLFNRVVLRRWPPWLLLTVAGAAAGVLLAPWSTWLEFAFGVVDLTEPGAVPLELSAAAYWAELRDEAIEAPLKTALIWPAMNALVIWRAGRAISQAAASRPAVEAPADASPRPGEATQAAAAPALPAHGSHHASAAEAAAALPPQARSTEAPAASSGFLDRLPLYLGRDIVLLQAEEHYLRVITTRGDHVLLFGLARAVADLVQGGIAGAQVHRSYWVGWRHVQRIDQRPGALAVCLLDGRRIPLGRRRAREVQLEWEAYLAASPAPPAQALPDRRGRTTWGLSEDAMRTPPDGGHG